MSLIQDYQEQQKNFEKLEGNNPREKQLLANVRTSMVEFLKDTLVKFKDVQKKVAKIELNSVAKIYMFVQQLLWETQSHTQFTNKFQKVLNDSSQHITTDLMQICSMSSSDWDEVKSRIQKRVAKKQKKLETSPEGLLIDTKPAAMSRQVSPTPGRVQYKWSPDVVAALPEPILMRKVTKSVREQHKRFTTRGLQAPITAKVLAFILHKLEKGYDDGLKF